MGPPLAGVEVSDLLCLSLQSRQTAAQVFPQHLSVHTLISGLLFVSWGSDLAEEEEEEEGEACVWKFSPLFFFTCPQFPESIISIFSWLRWGRQGWRPGAHLWPLLRVCLHRDGVCTFVSFESCQLLISGSLLFVYYLLNCHAHKVGAASMFMGLQQKCKDTASYKIFRRWFQLPKLPYVNWLATD